MSKSKNSKVKKNKPRGKPFSKGASGNPEGAPPRSHWWSTLIEERAKAEDKMKKMKNREVIADALIREAKKGSISHIKEFGDRVQGKAPQSIGRIGEDGEFEEQNLIVIYGKDE